jgi:homoserine dehydrogenase
LAFGKFLKVDDIYTEGITHISHVDIEHAESLNLCIKLLAIAKKEHNVIEARVSPTLISKDHPLASIKSNNNAVYLESYPMGNILLSGQGAGQLPAASGIVSDLINFAAKGPDSNLLSNIYSEATNVGVRKIDEVRTKFYMRFMAVDKPGVLSQITGILGRYGIGINSVSQKQHVRTGVVPVVMLTDYTTERNARRALEKIYMLPLVKTRPVAIRMEKLL